MAEINWSLAQTPNYFQGAVQAQQAAQQERQIEADRNAAMAARYHQQQREAAQDQRQVTQDERQTRIDAQPKFIEGPDGIYAVDPSTGKSARVADYPVKPPTAPSGYQWAPGGNVALQYIPGGPGDPQTIGGIAQTRRDVVVKNPLPSRARAAGGASTNLPPPPGGWRPAQ